MEWPSPDLSPKPYLDAVAGQVKGTVHAKKPFNVTKLKRCCLVK